MEQSSVTNQKEKERENTRFTQMIIKLERGVYSKLPSV